MARSIRKFGMPTCAFSAFSMLSSVFSV